MIIIHQEKATGRHEALRKLCPFGAIESLGDKLEINANCRMCKLCVRSGGGAFEFVEDAQAADFCDTSSWRDIAVVAEFAAERLHPVTLELLGKARELAAKSAYAVKVVLIGSGVSAHAATLAEYGAEKIFVYDDPAFEHFRVEPYAAALEDFIKRERPSVVLVGGTQNGRSLAPRVAARFRTGLTADCTRLDISPRGDLDQIRPAYGGNIMAHINTPAHRPQFATVRYKIFPLPEKLPAKKSAAIERAAITAAMRVSRMEVLSMEAKAAETSIEEAEVIVAAGRGVRKAEDLEMLRKLAAALGGMLAGTRPLMEAGWIEPRAQIGLSGRTVKPKLIITAGVSGAIQFAAGMNGAEKIIAINSDPEAPIFKIANVCIVGDIYEIIPRLLEKIKNA